MVVQVGSSPGADAAPDEPDNVALDVGLAHLDTTPLIHWADVVWGSPHAHVEAHLFPEPVVFSEENLGEVLRRLPELLAALQEALRRGRPPSDGSPP
jgi:hypothetical protein